MEKNKNIKTNIAYQIAYRVITIITPFITSPILSRALGAENLGIYSATLAFTNYFMLFSLLGVENYGNRSIAAVQDEKVKRREVFWSIYTVQAAACFLSIGAYILALYHVDSTRKIISLLQGIWLLSSLLNVNWYFFGTEQFRLTVLRSITVKIISVLAIAIFIRTPDDLNLYAFIMSADAALSCAILWPFLLREIGFVRPSWGSVRSHIKPILVLFVPILAVSVFHIMDKSMLDRLSNAQQLGFYYSADKVINIPLMAITAVGTVMLPRVSNVFSSGHKAEINTMLHKSFELTAILTCSIGVGIASIANEFIPFFFGPGFDSCIILVYWFVAILFAKAFGDFIRMQYLVPTHQDKVYTIAICIGALSNLVLNSILIPTYGALGAVWATLAAEAIVTVVQAVYVKDSLSFVHYLRANTPYLFFSIVMLFIVRLTAKHLFIPIWLKIGCMVCIGAISFLSCCLVYWRLNNESIFHNIATRIQEKLLARR